MSNPYDPYATGDSHQPEGQQPNQQPFSQSSAGWEGNAQNLSGQNPSSSYGAPTSQPSSSWENTGAVPTSQPSSSWESTGAVPTSQPSSGYPGSQPTAGTFGNPGDGGSWNASSAGSSEQWTPTGTTAAPSGERKEGGLGAIFDLTFRKYATPSIAKIVYILVLVVAVLSWLGPAVTFFSIGSMNRYDDGVGVVLGFLYLLFGWIPALLEVVMFRIFMELAIANIRTAEDVEALRQKLG